MSKNLTAPPPRPPVNQSPPTSTSAIVESYAGRSVPSGTLANLEQQAVSQISSDTEDRHLPETDPTGVTRREHIPAEQPFAYPPVRQLTESPHQSGSPPSAFYGGPSGLTRSPFTASHRKLSGFSLPSPSSLESPMPPTPLNNPTLIGASSPPPRTSGSGQPDPAHKLHLQDLQHELSKKSLALMTLKTEHETLLSAYSRQQTRCITLDKKSKVSDNEINTLTEEKLRLQDQVESLESQVEELLRARDDAQKRNVADSQQYMQIMAMSSKLQAQSAEETRRWKAEREKWEQEKSTLAARIQRLENQNVHSTTPDPTIKGSGVLNRSDTSDDQVDFSSDPVTLKAEIIGLRKIIEAREKAIQRVTAEAEEIGRVMNSLTMIQVRLSNAARVNVSDPVLDRGNDGSEIPTGTD